MENSSKEQDLKTIYSIFAKRGWLEDHLAVTCDFYSAYLERGITIKIMVQPTDTGYYQLRPFFIPDSANRSYSVYNCTISPEYTPSMATLLIHMLIDDIEYHLENQGCVKITKENIMLTQSHIDSAEAAIDEAKKKYRKMAQEYAEQICPFKIGDRSVIYGRAHRGKKMVIENIRHSDVPGSYWKVTGRLIRSNDKTGAAEVGFNQNQYELGLDGIFALVEGIQYEK